MSELKTNLEQILQEKTTKLIPENIKRKVEIFDVIGTDGDTEVEELQAKIIETRQEIADTRRDLENATASVSGTGESVTLNGTSEATFKKLDIGGNSKQQTTTGKNKLILRTLTEQTVNGITFTPVFDENNNTLKYINVNGTATANANIQLSGNITLDGTFTLSSGIGISATTHIMCLDSSTYAGVLRTDIAGSQTATLTNRTVLTYLYVTNGTTVNNVKIYPMIEEGSTETSYEPYTGGQASPNPDYPQEINNVVAKNKLETSLEMIKSINTTGTWNDNVYTNAGLTLTVNDDLSVILNGTTTSHFSFMLNNLVTLKKGTYILNGINTVNSNALLYIWNSDWNNIVSATNSSEFTINADTLIRTGINISSEKTFDNFVVKAMISEEGGEYSPYNCVSIKIQNKNLFDEENATVLHSNTRSTIQYVNNSIKVTAGQTSSSAFVTTKVCDVKYLTNKTLTVKAYWQGTNSGHTEIGYCDSDGLNRISLGVINSSGNSVTITIPDNLENKVLILWFYAGGNADGYVNYSNVQVEYGSAATTYVKHEEQTFTFPLGNEKLMLGDYLADDGIHHIKWQYIFTGEEEFKKSITYRGNYWVENRLFPKRIKSYTPFICTHAISVSLLEDFKIGTCFNDGTVNLWLGDETQFPTVESFKTYLAEQYTNGTSVILEYELYEEEITPYTSAQQEVYDAMKKAISYRGQTNISSLNDTGLIFTVTAFRDPDLAITSLENRVTLLED